MVSLEIHQLNANKSHLKESPRIYFKESVNVNLKCVYCNNLLQSPMQTSCGHRFCKKCLEGLKGFSSGAATCPEDGEELNPQEIFADRCCEKDIQKLQCFCYNQMQGCQWLGELSDLKDHVSKCEYSLVECPSHGCTERMEKKYLDDHVRNTCKYRLITCEKCNAQQMYVDKELHVAKCPRVEIQCTTGCGAVMARGDLEEHVTKHCVNAPIACPFENSGCDFKGSRGDVEDHKSVALVEHIQILSDKNMESSESLKKMEEKVENLESEKEHLEKGMEESREALAYAKQDLQTTQTKISIVEKKLGKQKEDMVQLKQALENLKLEKGGESTMEVQITEIISLVQSQEKRVADLERDLIQGGETRGFATNSINSVSERRLDRHEHACAVSEAKIYQHDIRLQMLEATSYDGKYIWKIDEWSKRVRDARIGKTTSIYSPPFYIGRYGYKVCGRLYPCGDGIGKDTHVSLFFVVMKGEYDALLSWPFSQKVTFKLLDPNRLNDISDSFRPDPKSTSFQRPKSAMNIASGTPQFVSQRTLDNGGYVTDDTLFIKISVDETGLRQL